MRLPGGHYTTRAYPGIFQGYSEKVQMHVCSKGIHFGGKLEIHLRT